jgi:hypothetical protein
VKTNTQPRSLPRYRVDDVEGIATLVLASAHAITI